MAARKHGLGVANTVATVSVGDAGGVGVNQPSAREVRVRSVAGADPIYVTVDGSTPTIRGDNTHVVPVGGQLQIPARNEPPISVSMLSVTGFTYAVEVLSE